MSFIAKLMARELWWAMLWLMRRPWMKQFQRASLRLVRSERRPRALNSMRRQNMLARRFGLPILVFAMNLVLASLIITGAFFLLLSLESSGALRVP